MRVLFTAPPYVGMAGCRGGVFREMQNRASSLEALGHRVEYLDTWSRIDWDGFDLCHLFMANGDSHVLGLEISRRLPLVVSPIIDQVRGNLSLRLSVAFNRLVPGAYTHMGKCRDLCGIADLVILRSREELCRLEAGLGLKGKGVVVPCPVSLPAGLRTSAPRRTGHKILFLGDMRNRRKNVLRLIKAVSSLECTLDLAGTAPIGSDLAELRALCRRTPNVRLIGPADAEQKWQLLDSCDVLALPSLMEGIGLAGVEAGLMGKTVVVTRNGGAIDYFGESGAYYVDPLRIDSIREGLRSALDRPIDCSAALREACSPGLLGAALEKAYTEVLGTRAVPTEAR